MTMWKCEGRCVVILVLFMVQTLFIISGVGAESSSLPPLSKSSVVTSSSVPTSSEGTLTSSPAQQSTASVVTSSSVPTSSEERLTSSPAQQSTASVVTIVSVPTTLEGPLTSSPAQQSTASVVTSSSVPTSSEERFTSSPAQQSTASVVTIVSVPTTLEGPLTSSPAQQSTASVVTSSSVPTSSEERLTSSPAQQSTASVVTIVSVPTSSEGPLTSSPAQNSITITPKLSTQAFIQTSTSLLVQPMTSAVGPSPHTSITTSFASSVSINATSAPEQELYIVMTFKMPWGRLCFLLSLFKKALSDDLIETKGLKYKSVNQARIKFRNNVKCKNKTYYNDNAVLEIYISDSRTEDLTSNSTVDREMTIKAFKILYGYWVNKRMILLDKMFEKKVEKVELKGPDQDKYIAKYTEAQRIGIGIGVGLAVVVLILLIYCCVRGCVEGKSVGHSTEEKRMIFTNRVAINEEARTDTEGSENTGSADTPRSDLKETEEPEEVVIHTQPLAKTQDEMPLRSVIKDLEDGQRVDQTESDEKSDTEKAPLAKPELDNVSEGEPIKSTDEPEAEPIKSPDELEGEPANELEAVITPDSGPATIEFPVAETAPEPANEVDVKPDFGQSDNIDVDPSQGAINMAFDDQDEATGEGDEEEDEETKF